MSSQSPKPTKTTNRLRFDELHPKRFEDLCLALLLPQARWQELRHYGRSGRDRGVDIFGLELLEGSRVRSWYVQCKCEQNFARKKLLRTVDEAITKETVPDVFLVVVTADISRQAHEAFKHYATEKGISQAFI